MFPVERLNYLYILAHYSHNYYILYFQIIPLHQRRRLIQSLSYDISQQLVLSLHLRFSYASCPFDIIDNYHRNPSKTFDIVLFIV